MERPHRVRSVSKRNALVFGVSEWYAYRIGSLNQSEGTPVGKLPANGRSGIDDATLSAQEKEARQAGQQRLL